MTLITFQNTDVDASAEVIDPTDRGVGPKLMLIKAPASNTGTLYIGPAGVSATTGISLAAGEVLPIKLNDGSMGAVGNLEVYAIASEANQKVEVFYQ